MKPIITKSLILASLAGFSLLATANYQAANTITNLSQKTIEVSIDNNLHSVVVIEALAPARHLFEHTSEKPTRYQKMFSQEKQEIVIKKQKSGNQVFEFTTLLTDKIQYLMQNFSFKALVEFIFGTVSKTELTQNKVEKVMRTQCESA